MIDKLQKLARLQFSEEEAANIEKDLTQMLTFIEKINEIDTSEVEPLIHLSDNVNAVRKDETHQLIEREAVLKNAPKADESFFKVPKVIDK